MDELLHTIQTYDYYHMCELRMDQLRDIARHYGIKPAKTKRILAQNIVKYVKCMKSICPICVDVVSDKYIVTECQHVFCDSCILQHFKISFNCPICRNVCNATKIIAQISIERILEINSGSDSDAKQRRTGEFSRRDGCMSIFQSGYLFISVVIVTCIFIVEITLLIIVCYAIVRVVADSYMENELLKTAMVAIA